jgi:hypothetical protein
MRISEIESYRKKFNQQSHSFPINPSLISSSSSSKSNWKSIGYYGCSTTAILTYSPYSSEMGENSCGSFDLGSLFDVVRKFVVYPSS